jgi:hypothetical protein
MQTPTLSPLPSIQLMATVLLITEAFVYPMARNVSIHQLSMDVGLLLGSCKADLFVYFGVQNYILKITSLIICFSVY